MAAELRYLLLETATGYALFERGQGDEVALRLQEVQQSVTDFSRFSRMLSLRAFVPFKTAEEALENINAVAEGSMAPTISAFLEANLPLPKPGKKSSYAMGVSAHNLGGTIQDSLGISCLCNDLTAELIRGVRLHMTAYVSALRTGDLERAQLGLAHSYSRSKVKFDVHRADKHIIQSIAILDTLDKDINTFAMRVREWYSWHFPELVKVVNDNYIYARLIMLIKKRDSLNDESLPSIEEIVLDEHKAQAVLDAARHSMGMDISDIDLLNVTAFAERVVKLTEYRLALQEYLRSKLELVAPNLQALVGDAGRRAPHLARRLADQPGQVSRVDCADPRCREGALPRAQDARQHAQVRPHLPLILHRPRRRQEQGPHLALPRQQVLHRRAHR